MSFRALCHFLSAETERKKSLELEKSLSATSESREEICQTLQQQVEIQREELKQTASEHQVVVAAKDSELRAVSDAKDTELLALRKELEKMNEALYAERDQCADLERQLQQHIQMSQAAVKELTNKMISLHGEMDSALEDKRGQLEDLTKRCSAWKHQAAESEHQIANLSAEVAVLRRDKVCYRRCVVVWRDAVWCRVVSCGVVFWCGVSYITPHCGIVLWCGDHCDVC